MTFFVACPECNQPRWGLYASYYIARVSHPDMPHRLIRSAEGTGLHGYAGVCDGSHAPDHEGLMVLQDRAARHQALGSPRLEHPFITGRFFE